MPARIARRRSPIDGNGVFALRKLPAGIQLIEYRGRLRTHDEVQEIYPDAVETGHTFLFTLNDLYVIDANFEGNIARWINHSCTPNCEAILYEDGEGGGPTDSIVIETLREIDAGEEITFDYRIELDVPHTPRLKRLWACRCGSPACTGTMLRRKRPRNGKTAA